MTTKVQKWGNSYAVRIPKGILKETQLSEGSSVTFSVEDNSIVLSYAKKPKYTLDELLKDFDIKNKHELVDWGPDVGNEILPPWPK
ncbi:MAG: AbrB/MazE/SpoVT family DNA-binding domain-containing protein [Patescibacteria group bacterium]